MYAPQGGGKCGQAAFDGKMVEEGVYVGMNKV